MSSSRIPDSINAGGAEIENAAVDAPIESDGAVAQGTKGHRYWPSGYYVVDDFVPDQDLQRVNPRLFPHRQHDDRFPVGNPFRSFPNCNEIGGVDGWDPVFGRPSRANFGKIHNRSAEVGIRPGRLPIARMRVACRDCRKKQLGY